MATEERVANRDLSEDERLRMYLRSLWSHHDGGNPSHFLEALADATERETWQALDVSLKEFVTTEPPKGLGIPFEQFKALYHIQFREERDFPSARTRYSAMRKAINEELAKAEKPSKRARQERADITDISSNKPCTEKHGTGRDHAIRRLRSEGYEDLSDRLAAEEQSANSAMVDAGFRDRTFTVSTRMEKAARTLAKHFDPEELYEAMKQAQQKD